MEVDFLMVELCIPFRDSLHRQDWVNADRWKDRLHIFPNVKFVSP